MYQKRYEIISQDSSRNYRKIEREALMKAIKAMRLGYEAGPTSHESIRACILMQKIWSIILTDVMDDENKLPLDLRANIISIGIWIQRELTDILSGKSNNLTGVIEINQIIADGLL